MRREFLNPSTNHTWFSLTRGTLSLIDTSWSIFIGYGAECTLTGHRWCLRRMSRTVMTRSVGQTQTRWRTLMIDLGGARDVDWCPETCIVILEKKNYLQFNHFNWRWATRMTSHLQEKSLSLRTLRATMTLWETKIFLFYQPKYCSFQRSLPVPPRDIIEVLCADVTMTALTVQWYLTFVNLCDSEWIALMLYTSWSIIFLFTVKMVCCWLGAVYYAAHLPWQSGHSNLLQQAPI